MELGTNLMNSLRTRIAAPGRAAESGAIDWFSLQTRLVAGHAARQALVRAESLSRLRTGAFAQWADLHATGEWGAPVVNPNDLADRKGAAGKGGHVADHVARGDRG